MLQQFIAILIDVVVPVFGIAGVGYLFGPRLGLDSRTLARSTYYIFVPAMIFDVFSAADIQPLLALRMFVAIGLVYGGCALIGLLVGILLRRPEKVICAYVLTATFGNNGNYGLPLLEFRLGEEALIPGLFYMLAISMVAFPIGIGAAKWSEGEGWKGFLEILKAPPILAIIPAALFNAFQIPIPVFLDRMAGVLGQGMIPVMLVVLGLQLAEAGRPKLDRDILLASAFRILLGPLLAWAILPRFGLDGLELSTGILQASMPVAMITIVIAIEHDLLPEQVTNTVLFSTVASFFTLSVLLSVV